MARRRSIIPAIPLRRRALPWVLFALGFASIGFGAVSGEVAGVAIGVIVLGGALASWAAEWLLGRTEPDSANREDDGQ